MSNYLPKPNLVVHTNSYVTLEEVDEYVNNLYMSTQPEYIAWFEGKTSDGDKIRALIASCRALQKIPYRGNKKGLTRQTLAFPRSYNVGGPGVVGLWFTSQTFDNTLVDGIAGGGNGLASAKQAQIVNALAMLTLDQNIVKDVTERVATGLRSRKIQAVQEDYGSASVNSTALLEGLYAKDAVYKILNNWIGQDIMSL